MKHYHDLGQHHFKRELNGLTIIGGWVKDNEENAWKRTLYLMPAGTLDQMYRTGEGFDRTWYLIEEPGMHGIALDAEGDIGRQDFAYDQASAALQSMGLVDSLTNRHMIIGIINDHLDQLFLMPPRPAVEQRAAADIVILDQLSGRRIEGVAMEDA